MTPLISIIVPVYNAEKYLSKAVNSIVNQTYSNLEIWLCDDASTDNSREILRSFSDPRIKTYFLDKNTNKIGIVNEVLAIVTGEFVAFQDADDWSDPTRLEKQMKAILQNQECGLVFTNITIKHHKTDTPTIMKAPISDAEIKKFFREYGKNQSDKNIACATMLVRKDVIKEIGGYNSYFFGKAGSDLYLTYQILKLTNVFCLDEPLYHVERTRGSFTEQLHSLKNIKSVYIWKVISKLIHYDQKNINLLSEDNKLILKEIELECCELAFIENNDKLKNQLSQIKKSISYRLGNFFVKPFSFLKAFNSN